MASNRLAGDRVHLHRVSLGLSPEQYGSQVVKVSGMTVRRVEEGYTPFLSTQLKFATALDTTIAELFPASVKSRRKRSAKRSAVAA